MCLIIQEFRYSYNIKCNKTYLICCSWRMFYTGDSSGKKGNKHKKCTNQQAVNFPKWKEWTGSHPDSIHHDFQLAPFYKLAAIYEQGEGTCNIKWITTKTITEATQVRSNKHTDYMIIIILVTWGIFIPVQFRQAVVVLNITCMRKYWQNLNSFSTPRIFPWNKCNKATHLPRLNGESEQENFNCSIHYITRM